MLLFTEPEQHGMYEVLSVISFMLIFLAIVIYIFTKRYKREEVRAPLEDDNSEDTLPKN
jgi:uncharacterized membrane protein